MSSNQQGNDVGALKNATSAPELSEDCTNELKRLTKINNMAGIVVYSTNGKPEAFVLPWKQKLTPQNCSDDDLIEEYHAPSGRCGKPPMVTCKWISVGGQLYWVCA